MMINLRQIDRRFFLSGGWSNVPEDAEYIKQLGIGCVLDLQYLPDDPSFNAQAQMTITPILEHFKIEYWIIPMFDGPNPNLKAIFQEGYDCLSSWVAEFPSHKILIKCGSGVSRSVAMLISFYGQAKGMSFQESYDKIFDASRSGLALEHGFREYLKERYPDPDPKKVAYYKRKTYF